MSAKWWAPVLVMLASTPAFADPIFTFGGGYAADRTFESREDQIPLGWIGFRVPLQEHWSGFVRFAYAKVAAPMAPEVARFVPRHGSEWRATYFPMTLGLRLAGGRRMSHHAFAELGSSLTWGVFEAERAVYDPFGPLDFEIVQEEHWMAGIELGAGMHHAIDGTVGFEWGVRFEQWTAPPRGWATSGLETTGLRRLALVAGFTLTPSTPDLLGP